MMNEARFGVGLQGIAVGEVAYQKSLAFARERVQGRDAVTGRSGVTIINHPDVRRMLATMRAKVMARACWPMLRRAGSIARAITRMPPSRISIGASSIC